MALHILLLRTIYAQPRSEVSGEKEPDRVRQSFRLRSEGARVNRVGAPSAANDLDDG
jgi:hypothetical protein